MALLQTLGAAVQTLAPAAQYPTPYTVGPFAQPLTELVPPPPPPPPPPPGGAPVFFPGEPCVDLEPEELATIVWDAIEQWNGEVEDTSRDLAALTALKAYPGGDTLGTQYAAVVALVVADADDDDELD